jgi:hypothetical protein
MHSLTTWSLAALAAATLLLTSPLAAQPARGATITIALADSLPIATAKAVVVRQADGGTLLALDRRHATPELLGMGLALIRSVSRTPLPPGQQRVMPIQGGVSERQASPARMAFLRARLNELTRRPHGQLGTLGRGRFLAITDPTITR